jgi:eukaryotic-like serine/threonine-protein kinase
VKQPEPVTATIPAAEPPVRRRLEITQDYPGEAAPAPVSRDCKIGLQHGSGPCFVSETMALLRRRLRVAALIMSAGFGVFLLRSLADPEGPITTAFDRSFQAAVTLLTALIAGLLWSKRLLCPDRLRAVELATFGLAAAFFAWLQFGAFTGTQVAEIAAEGKFATVFRVVAVTSAFRWFLLIVLYGTFIPNTWRRSAAVIGVLALWPLAQAAVQGLLTEATRAAVPGALLDMSLVVGIGAAIAVFGSYKISSLHEQAFEARKLGQYRLKQKLGQGGMGEVFLAEHVLLRRPCAIKLIKPEQAGDVTSLKRFEREVQVTATLTHWNTVEIYDYGHTPDGTFYYVMEYLPGPSLQDLVDEQGPLPPARAVHFLRQVCQALREAHAIGLIHRDIKPSNILVCERGGVPDVVKLLDFGLVRCVERKETDARLTQEGTVAGSPLYLSPEQARGRSDLDARSDIYSVGTVAYFLLTGTPPFERDSALEALMAHVYEAVRFPPHLLDGIPPDLQAVVMQCLEKDPAKRFQSVVALERALAQCAGGLAWTEEKAQAWWNGRDASGRADGRPAALMTPATVGTTL